MVVGAYYAGGPTLCHSGPMSDSVAERTRSGRTYAGIMCGGVMLAAAVAWIVGSDLDGYGSGTFDALVGGSGIVATVCALLALPRAGWAAVPLVPAGATSALMAYARLSEPEPGSNDIDLTPFMLPPVIFLLGGLALIMVSLAPPADGSR